VRNGEATLRHIDRKLSLRIAIIAKPAQTITGIGRYVDELCGALKKAGNQVEIVYPVIPLPFWLIRLFRKMLHWDLEAFFNNYPLWAHYPQADIYHISSQNLATLMIFHRPPGKVMITVHDLIPATSKGNKEISITRHKFDQTFDSIAIRGLDRADGLIAISGNTKKIIIGQMDSTNENF
jgi:glycosyltransferase involved in cell wall biosynthesis